MNTLMFSTTPNVIADLGSVVSALGVLVVLALNIKSLFWPQRSLSQEFVQKHELNDCKEGLDKDIAGAKVTLENRMNDLHATYVNKAEMQKIESKLEVLAASHKELFDYTHKNVHEMLTKVSELVLKLEGLHRTIDKEMAADRERIISKIENTAKEHKASFDRLSDKINNLELQVTGLRAVKDSTTKENNASFDRLSDKINSLELQIAGLRAVKDSGRKTITKEA